MANTIGTEEDTKMEDTIIKDTGTGKKGMAAITEMDVTITITMDAIIGIEEDIEMAGTITEADGIDM